MPMNISFRNGRLDASGAPAFSSRTIVIQDNILALAGDGAARALLPSSYRSAAAAQVVPLNAIVLNFGQRLLDYDPARLLAVVLEIQRGADIAPLSVSVREDGGYDLQNGYHRFLACALLGFSSIPIDRMAAPAAITVPAAGKYVPPHLRRQK